MLNKCKNIIFTIRTFFNPSILVDRIKPSVNALKEENKTITKAYEELSAWMIQYSETLTMITNAVQALVWKKNSDHQYELANPLHCKAFFGFHVTEECLQYIRGKTDEYLIKETYRARNIENTFGEICSMSDKYTQKKREVCHFLEAGVVDGEEVLLYVIKVPNISPQGEFKGIFGMGWDFTEYSKDLCHQLNRMIFDQKVTKLYHSDKVFAYAIQPEFQKCSIFRHICPKPASSTGLCDTCIEEGRCQHNKDLADGLFDIDPNPKRD